MIPTHRYDRGIVLSLRCHRIMCRLSGVSEIKSQKLSWADSKTKCEPPVTSTAHILRLTSLGDLVMGFRLDGVNEVREFD